MFSAERPSTSVFQGQFHHEWNYLISEETSLRVRDFVQCCLDFEERSVGVPNYSYPVHTLYLDSDDLSLYWTAINDLEHRKEVRLRYYSLNRGQPVYLEIKQRQSDAVLRFGLPVRAESIAQLLSGQGITAKHLATRHPRSLAAIPRFAEMLPALKPKPWLHLAYLREGYVNDDETARVSLDRQIVCEARRTLELSTRFESPHRLFAPFVLLELNCGWRVPRFFLELVEHFSLASCATDKYLEGMGALLSASQLAGE